MQIILLMEQFYAYQNQCQQLQQMQESIRQQMNRYPVFSCHGENYIDQSQLFKDEQIKNSNKKNLSLFARNQKKTQTIVSIYDRITSNNANDPLYSQARKEKQQFYSTITTARNSNCELDKKKDISNKNNRTNVITKFMGELAQSMSKEGVHKNMDIHRNQKISLLRRIIQHYNIKSVERKYYTNLIKNFGLKIQSVNTNEIAVKKNLHPRHSITRNITANMENSQNSLTQDTNTIKKQATQQINSTDIKSIDTTSGVVYPFKNSIVRRMKPSNTFVLSKQYSFNNSRENVSAKKSQNIRNCLGENIRARGQISQKMRRSIEYSQKLVQKPLKMQGSSSTSIQDKLNKYRDFLFLLNISNGIYRNLDIQKYQKPFKFYVGKGNNKNLIKSLMKKRFWFEETNDPNQANFIWTQIKLEQIFNKQESGIKLCSTLQNEAMSQVQTELQNLKVSDIRSQMTFDEKNLDTQCNQLKKQLKKHEKNFNINLNFNVVNFKQKSKTIKFNKCKTKAKDYAPRDPLLKIVIPEDAAVYRQISESLFYKKYPTFLDKVKICSKNLEFYFHEKSFMRIHNHFPLNGLLGNKKALYYNLKQYCKLAGKKLSEFIPLTYHIKKGVNDEEYKSISMTFIQRKKQKLPNYWIMKPGQFSNRGQGITCTNKLEQIRQRVNKSRQMTKSGKQSSLIVQLYITNPLLYNGRKFDIRVFMMVTINNGKIKGYWYQEGYVRTSSFVWSLSQMEDKFIHLTNDAIQKTCEEYGLYQPGNKLTFNDLQRYLHTLPKSGRNMQFFEAIYPQMRSIATDAIKCACLNLDEKRLRDNFQIFGLDFMIDQNVKPWLIEVNTNPCLQLNCPILQRVIPHMVQNAFRIAVDPLFPPPSSINSDYKYSIPENALHYNKFQLVFDEDKDGQALSKLYKNSTIMQKLDDIEQDQQLYECEGDMLDIKDEQ